MMQSKIIAYSIVLTMLYGCSTSEEAVPLSSVPATPVAVQTDLAETNDSLQAARVEALRRRMQALKDDAQAQDPIPVAADLAPVATQHRPDDVTPALAPEPAFNPKPAPRAARVASVPAVPVPAASAPAVMDAPVSPPPSVDVVTMPAATPDIEEATPALATPRAEPLEPIILRQPHAMKAGTEAVGEVFFPNNSSRLTAENRQKIVAALQRMPQGDYRFLVEGYASPLKRSTPKGELLNLRLSVARAKAVSDVLVDAGIAPERITIKGLSARNPRGFDEIRRRAAVWHRIVPTAEGHLVLWPQ